MKTINGDTVTVIELTQGKNVAVQGIIGAMAATKDWDYNAKNGIRRNVVIDGKRDKEHLIRFLLSLKPHDGIRASRISKEPIVIHGKVCENYLTSNLKTNRKV